jgi:serine/threonine protein kinase/Tol biopolymer transport system component
LIGQTLSHYRVTAALGAGGMGEVFRATDTTLGRDVAIKVLPPEVAQDPERLGRFKREAHLLASLNHPNIAAIYGLEEADGKPFLALELVEGEDLKERLARGAIPVDEALEIAEQIAEALEEAHGKGIVHRDLKPANVKLAPGGKVKVLDFGLAKAWAGDTPEGSSPSGALSQSPTLAHTGTVAGVILGTAAYMSPEQARGKAVDRRADIWSFGVLLWEMLSGKALFAGDTVTDVIAAVVTKEPDLGALPKATPPAVRRLLSRCLRKDPRTRLPDIGAARLELQDVVAGTAAEAAPSSADIDEVRRAEHRSRSRERWLWAVALVVAAGLASLFAYRQLTATPEPRPPAHFTLDTPEDLSFSSFDPVAVSPDGRHVAFVGTSPGGNQQLWMRSLDSLEARPLPGTEGADSPFWSADSAELAFVAGGEIRKLVLTGGTVQRLCALPEGGFTGGTWSSKGTIVFSTGAGSGRLYSVSEAGGEAKPLTSHDESRGETGHWWPQFLPDARHILVLVGSSQEGNTGLFVASLEAPGERRQVRPDLARCRYAAPGVLLFVQDGILLAQRFDAGSLVTMGDAIPIASSIATWSQTAFNWGWFSPSATGRVAWLSGTSDASRLEWVDREGRRIATLGEPGRYGQIALSPDDERVVAELAGANGQFDLWMIDVARGVPSRLTTDPANDRDPVWSPDSQEIVYSSDASGDQNLLRKELQGSEPAAPLPGGIGQTPGERDIAKDWLPEENTLLYLTLGPERTLWKVSLDGQGQPEALVKGFNVDQPHVSPDGHWLAYISQESGGWEVYVEPFGRRGERVRVSTGGGGQPRWRGDGKELFYLSLDRALMSVNVRAGATRVEVGLPTTLVPARDLQAVVEGPDYSDYSVSSDGQRILVKRPAEGGERPRIHVLLNWPSLLE